MSEADMISMLMLIGMRYPDAYADARATVQDMNDTRAPDQEPECVNCDTIPVFQNRLCRRCWQAGV